MALASVLGVSADAGAVTFVVPIEYPTIQAGIDAALHGDTVLVREGTYAGVGNRDIALNGKRILVRSEMGAESTIIDCGGSASDPHRGFYFYSSGETKESIVDGFTIQNGYPDDGNGGGIHIAFTDPTIRNCMVINCVGTDGAAVFCESQGAILQQCVFRNNAGRTLSISDVGLIDQCTIADNEGIGGFEGVGVWMVAGEIRNSTIAGNTGVGVVLDGVAVLRNCLITGNRGRAIETWYADRPLIEGCTIVGNDDPDGWGAIVLNYTREMLLRRTIIRDNCPVDVAVREDSDVRFECCAVNPSGVTGEGTIVYAGPQVTQDPQLCFLVPCDDAPTDLGDFHLQDTSPCLPENSPCGSLIGAFAEGCSPSSVPGGGLSSLGETADLLISPNPIPRDGRLVISLGSERGSDHGSGAGLSSALTDGTPAEIVVFDASGRERLHTIQEFRSEGMSLDVVELEAGAYFVRVRANGEQALGRFLRLR